MALYAVNAPIQTSYGSQPPRAGTVTAVHGRIITVTWTDDESVETLHDSRVEAVAP